MFVVPSALIQKEVISEYKDASDTSTEALRSRTALRPDFGGNIMTMKDAADPKHNKTLC